MNFGIEINEVLKTNRPTLSDSSCKTYASLFRGICKECGVEPNKDWLINPEHTTQIIEAIEKQNLNTRKTKYSAMFVLSNNEEYRKRMMDDIVAHQEIEMKQERNEKQEENWMEFGEIKSLYEAYKEDMKPVWKSKVILPQQLNELQQFMIFSLVSGVLMPPRRLKDYTDFKLRNVDKEKDNYMEGNKFIFNSYKTAKTYGRQEVEVPKTVVALMTKWKKVQPLEYLFTDSNGNKLSEVQLNQRIGKIFEGKKIGVNMLRHIYTTEKVHKHTPSMEKLQKVANAMGHSITQNILYKKNSTNSIGNGSQASS